MPNRVGTSRRKTRQKLKKPFSQRGKTNINKYLQVFKTGERVILKIEPAYQKAMYHPRFHGLSGIVLGMRGRCYLVQINDGDKQKKLIAHPVHLKRT